MFFPWYHQLCIFTCPFITTRGKESLGVRKSQNELNHSASVKYFIWRRHLSDLWTGQIFPVWWVKWSLLTCAICSSISERMASDICCMSVNFQYVYLCFYKWILPSFVQCAATSVYISSCSGLICFRIRNWICSPIVVSDLNACF